MLANEDMARVESEAGIIATLIHHPDFSYLLRAAAAKPFHKRREPLYLSGDLFSRKRWH